MMNHFILLYFATAFTQSLVAQITRTIYLGEDMDKRYQVISSRPGQDSGINRVTFMGYPQFQHRTLSSDYNQDINRPGIILDAKSTTNNTVFGEMVLGNFSDSVLVSYEYKITIVRHGRSAVLSVLNLFSKRENRLKQDDPYEEVIYQGLSGSIRSGNKTMPFSISGKNNAGWLKIDGDSLFLKPSNEYRKVKSGKIKTGPGGQLLMRGGACVAAIDYYAEPISLYLLKGLSQEVRLIIIAFFTVHHFRI